jgi:hypothetical protein
LAALAPQHFDEPIEQFHRDRRRDFVRRKSGICAKEIRNGAGKASEH